MDVSKIQIPSTAKEAVFNSAVAGLQLWVGSALKKPSAKNREALSTARLNLAINATPILLPIAAAILKDVAATVTKLFTPVPIQVKHRPSVIVIGPKRFTTDNPLSFGN
jgi:hypothetical protein